MPFSALAPQARISLPYLNPLRRGGLARHAGLVNPQQLRTGLPYLGMLWSMATVTKSPDLLMQVTDRSMLSGENPHQQQKPPSTSRSWPVQYDEASLARNMAGPTISSTLAMRCIGVWASNSLVWCTISGRVFIGVAV